MGQKIHPLGFRLGITQSHRSQWFAGNNSASSAQSAPEAGFAAKESLLNKLANSSYSQFLKEDFIIRKYLSEELQSASLSRVILSRRTNCIFIEVHVAQPKIVTGEGGLRLKELTQGIESSLARGASELTARGQARTPQMISFQVIQVPQPATDARLLAKKVAEQLEKRVAFRRVMKQSIEAAREAGISGVKIQIAGRLNGAEIARTEWIREGRVPLHTLNASIDYCSLGAQTIYGTLGIKVWLFHDK